MITIVDYGMGNLRSVQKAFERVGAPATITSRSDEVAAARALVLPGVGAFRDAMEELRRRDLIDPVKEFANSGKPFLGICLGLQLLFENSEEGGTHEGLGLIPGRVVRFPETPGFKVPHMGWNRLDQTASCPVFADIPPSAYFYFVHSFYVAPAEESVTAATSDYIRPFTAAIARDNLLAVQFHPEKSQQYGLELLKNFAANTAQP